MCNHSKTTPPIPTNTQDLKNLPLMLDVATACQIPGVSDRAMRKWCENGTVKAVKCGRLWRVSRDSLLTYCGLVAEA